MGIERLRRRQSSLLGGCSGAVAGLVAITPASGFVDVSGALVIGAAAGLACYWGATGLKWLLGTDDTLDVFGIHCVGGIVGAVLTGVFAKAAIGGAEGKVLVQAAGALATLIYSAAVSLVILMLLQVTIGLRVTSDEEETGLDLTQHGEAIE